jgi:hypothetical protein
MFVLNACLSPEVWKVNKSVKKEDKASTVRPGGKILVVDFLEHYNHEGKLIGINIRVTSPLSAG